MMQFNEKDVNRMIRACEYYEHWVCGNHPTGYMKEEYSHLLKKLHNYESEIDCPWQTKHLKFFVILFSNLFSCA